jgi:hypothetical protein
MPAEALAKANLPPLVVRAGAVPSPVPVVIEGATNAEAVDGMFNHGGKITASGRPITSHIWSI